MITLAIVGTACERHTPTQQAAASTSSDRKAAHANALKYLKDTVRALEEKREIDAQRPPVHESQRRFTSYDEKYRLPAYKAAKVWLETVPPESTIDPHPFLAAFSRRSDGDPAVLWLLWFEPTFDAHGVRLYDDGGDLGTFDNCIRPYTEDEKLALLDTLVRTAYVFFSHGAGGSAGSSDRAASRKTMLLPRQPGPNLRLVLRYRAGEESVPIAVRVQPGTFRTTEERAKEPAEMGEHDGR